MCWWCMFLCKPTTGSRSWSDLIWSIVGPNSASYGLRRCFLHCLHLATNQHPVLISRISLSELVWLQGVLPWSDFWVICWLAWLDSYKCSCENLSCTTPNPLNCTFFCVGPSIFLAKFQFSQICPTQAYPQYQYQSLLLIKKTAGVLFSANFSYESVWWLVQTQTRCGDHLTLEETF